VAGCAVIIVSKTVVSIETGAVRVTKIGIIYSCIIDSLSSRIAGETIGAVEASQTGGIECKFNLNYYRNNQLYIHIDLLKD
jgi:hypothetical protein